MRKKSAGMTLAFCLGLLFVGCTGRVSIKSNASRDYKGEINKIFISIIGVDKIDTLVKYSEKGMDSILDGMVLAIRFTKRIHFP